MNKIRAALKEMGEKNQQKAKEKELERMKVKCPLCRDVIPANALRCSHCASDLTETSVKAKVDEQVIAIQKRKKIVTGIVLVVIALIFWLMLSGGSDTQPQPTSSQSSVTTLNVGQRGVLHMTDDSGQIIFIATTESAFEELSKALVAKDTMGVLELAGQGKVFGVTNGSKVLIVDRSFVKRKVRILEGVRPIDADKVGLVGWVPVEWVVAEK